MLSSLRQLIVVLMVALPFAVVASGCPGPEYPKCEKDDHCKKDKAGKAINEYCLFGQCQQCAKDAHCGAGQKCNRGRCEISCTSDAQCGTGQICEEASCQPAQCSDSKPCSGSLQCTNGRCVPGQSTATVTPTDTGAGCERRQTVRFDFNASDLRPDAREILDSFARCLAQNGSWRLTIEGHADERGTTDYNLQLGERRASSVRDYLVRLGVDKARLKTLSYGEEKPLDPSSTEAAWALNRRGELVVQE
jgi:peptidoglycan-associated lipoprotein